MKLSVSAVAVLAVSGGASAYSVSRSSLRSLGQKSVSVSSSSQQRNAAGNLKMEGRYPVVIDLCWRWEEEQIEQLT